MSGETACVPTLVNARKRGIQATPTTLPSENRPSLEGKLKRATKKSGTASNDFPVRRSSSLRQGQTVSLNGRRYASAKAGIISPPPSLRITFTPFHRNRRGNTKGLSFVATSPDRFNFRPGKSLTLGNNKKEIKEEFRVSEMEWIHFVIHGHSLPVRNRRIEN